MLSIKWNDEKMNLGIDLIDKQHKELLNLINNIMYSIENNFLKIAVKDKGAELTSIFNKETNTEMLWQGDPEFWTGQAPILFPIVGGLKDENYLYEGKKYEILRHGFVRKSSDRKIKIKNDTTIECTFNSSPETLAIFPFNFELKVHYHLDKKELSITHYVVNTSESNIPVSIGAHPAFNCPLDKQTTLKDYYLKFEKTENSKTHLLNEQGLLSGETETCLENTNTLHLSETIFDKDALVFKDLKSEKISLHGPTGKLLSVSYPYFPFMGIWSKPKAPYVCIEPWIGHADTANSEYNLFDKEGSVTLKPNQDYTASYYITIS